LPTPLTSGKSWPASGRALHPDVVVVDVTPAEPAGFLMALRLKALPDAPPVVLTSSSSLDRFGSQLDHDLFIAKADVSARAIEECLGHAMYRPGATGSWSTGT
jgi:hypothetical protein